MGQIYLIRHGQASFGGANYDQLSELGVKQAGMLGDWFAQCSQGFHRIVTGSMQRHQQTADACLARLPAALLVGAERSVDAGFNEYDHHEVLIRYRPEFDDRVAFRRFFAETQNARYVFQDIFQAAMARWMHGGHDAEYSEPWPEFRGRCLAAFERLISSSGQSQSIAVFTSGGTIATLCQHFLGLEDRQVAELNWTLVNGAVTKLLYRPGKVTLSYLNNYSHLEWFGQAETITYR